MTTPLYRRSLGASFDRLPPAVRRLHDLDGTSTWEGRADVERGTTLIARLAAVIGGLPPSGRDQALTVTFTQQGAAEIWHRQFGRFVFRTVQSPGDGVIRERMGPATLLLAPTVSSAALTQSLAGLRVLGIPVPRFLLPDVMTREHEADGRYRFEVDVSHKWIGRLVRYDGWLAQKPA